MISCPNNSANVEELQCDRKEPNTQHKMNFRSASAQILATLIQNGILLDIGLTFEAQPLVLGAFHRNSASELSLDDNQVSWLGSITSICHLIGSIASGLLQEQFGRKGSMILVNIPFLCAWLILYFANSVSTLCTASIMLGLCAGFSEAPLHSYCGEISEPHIRGTLSALCVCATILGSVSINALGYLFGWRMTVLICSAVPVFTFVLMIQIPESPTYLLMRGRLEDARKSLCWLRGWVNPDEIKEEFQTMVNYTKQRVASFEPEILKEDGEEISEDETHHITLFRTLQFYSKIDQDYNVQPLLEPT